MGRGRKQRRGLDMQASCAAGAAREDVGISHLVPGPALAGAHLRPVPVRPVLVRPVLGVRAHDNSVSFITPDYRRLGHLVYVVSNTAAFDQAAVSDTDDFIEP